MKRSFVWVLLLVVSFTLPGWGAALGTAANSVIPKEVQQIISVDYRALANSPTALALKARVLPDSLKSLETSLRGVGVNPDKDVETLTFASFRVPNQGVRIVGIAQGQFSRAQILKRMQARKIRPVKFHSSFLYPMASGVDVTFLDNYTMLFGESAAVKNALDTRDGASESLNANSQVTDMIQSVNGGAVWSVLDAQGTQNMMRSTLGDAARLADYETVKKRLLGSVYTMDFNNGVKFDLNVLTSDSMTAATLSSLIRAAVMFKKMNATGVEKTTLESVTVDSDNDKLQLKFRTDDQKFQSLLQSPLFTSIAR